MNLHEDIIHFLCNQGCVVVSTLDENRQIHCSVKGIVGIKADKIYIIDLYQKQTYRNLSRNDTVSVTVVNEHQFKGYTIQGRGKIIPHKEIEEHIVQKWEEKIIQRITSRTIRGVQRGVKSAKHFEAHLPSKPKYLIEIDVEKVIDLSPPPLGQEQEGK